jgi:hypothetical protein
MAASVSSGRPVAFLGWLSVIARRLGGVAHRDGEGLDDTGGRGGLQRNRVRLHGDDRRARGDLGGDGVRAGEDGLGCLDAALPRAHVDGVGDEAGRRLDRQTGGDLLAGGVARDDDGRRGDLLHQRREDLGLRRHEEAGGVGVIDDVHLVRAVLGERDLGAVGAGADVDGGGLAEAAGDRQQLSGCLAQASVGVVDENEYFSHGGVLPCLVVGRVRGTSGRRGTPPAGCRRRHRR